MMAKVIKYNDGLFRTAGHSIVASCSRHSSDAPHAKSDVLTAASVRRSARGIQSEHAVEPDARGAVAAGSWQVPGW